MTSERAAAAVVSRRGTESARRPGGMDWVHGAGAARDAGPDVPLLKALGRVAYSSRVAPFSGLNFVCTDSFITLDAASVQKYTKLCLKK